jgi:hypothetical protein
MPAGNDVGAAHCQRFAPYSSSLAHGRDKAGGPEMFPPGLLLALGGTLLLTVADSVPVLNVDSGCRAAAKMGDSLSLDTTMRQCLADENSARDELQKQWAQFALALRQRCVATTETGGNPSYVEVLVCLQMGRDAAQMEKSSGGGRQE